MATVNVRSDEASGKLKVTQVSERLIVGNDERATLNLALSADSIVDAVLQVAQGRENLIEVGRFGKIHIPHRMGMRSQCRSGGYAAGAWFSSGGFSIMVW